MAGGGRGDEVPAPRAASSPRVTALAWLSGTSEATPVLVQRPREEALNKKKGDDNLVTALTERKPVAVALDAPLGLPAPGHLPRPAVPDVLPDERSAGELRPAAAGGADRVDRAVARHEGADAECDDRRDFVPRDLPASKP